MTFRTCEDINGELYASATVPHFFNGVDFEKELTLFFSICIVNMQSKNFASNNSTFLRELYSAEQ